MVDGSKSHRWNKSNDASSWRNFHNRILVEISLVIGWKEECFAGGNFPISYSRFRSVTRGEEDDVAFAVSVSPPPLILSPPPIYSHTRPINGLPSFSFSKSSTFSRVQKFRVTNDATTNRLCFDNSDDRDDPVKIVLRIELRARSRTDGMEKSGEKSKWKVGGCYRVEGGTRGWTTKLDRDPDTTRNEIQVFFSLRAITFPSIRLEEEGKGEKSKGRGKLARVDLGIEAGN